MIKVFSKPQLFVCNKDFNFNISLQIQIIYLTGMLMFSLLLFHYYLEYEHLDFHIKTLQIHMKSLFKTRMQEMLG